MHRSQLNWSIWLDRGRHLSLGKRAVEVDPDFEELEELQRLIERGPDWNTIVSIVVTLNPERTSYPDDTVEAAEQR
jgi:hypothetical protein